MKFLRIIPLILSAAAVVGCTHTQQPADTFAGVRHSIAAGQYQAACDELDEVSKQLENTPESAAELAESAVLYLVVGDHLADDNFLKALGVYRRAMQAAPDSVGAYFATLSPDEVQYKLLLEQLSAQLDKIIAGESICVPDFDEMEAEAEGIEAASEE